MYVWQNFGVRNVLGQIPKSVYQATHFYLVIFLTIFHKLVRTEIEWKIANSAETDIDVSLKTWSTP